MLKIRKEEEVKTAFEEFEAELKKIIFQILYVMLKDDDDGSIVNEIILSVGDGLQTLGLTFNISIPFPWKNDDFIFYFQSALYMIQISYWCSYLNWVSYVIIFYIFNVLIILVMCDIIYIAYSFHTGRFSVFWPLSILRSTCGLFVTVLFMPLIDLLTSMPQCDYDDDGTWVQQFFPDIVCWKGMHLLHTIVGFTVAGLFIVICMIVSLTYYESKDDPNDPGAKVNNRCEVVNNTTKIIGVIVTTFFIQESHQWMIAIVLTLTSFIVFIKCHLERPYYNELINRISDINNGTYLWSCGLLILAMLLADTEYTASVPLFFLGTPIIGVIFYTMDFHGDKLLMKPIEQFESGDDWYRKIKYYIALIHNKDTDRKAAIELKGFIYDHEETCQKKDCPLKLYKNNITAAIQDKKRKVGKNLGIENNNLLWNYANRLFQQGIAKYPNTTLMGIAYAQFLIERMGNKTLARHELARVSKLDPPFDQQFVIYRYDRLMEDIGVGDGDDDSGGQSGNADLVSVIAFNNYYEQCQDSIKEAARRHTEFWTELEKKEPDLGKLSETGSKINAIISEIEECWTQMQKLSPNHGDALHLYGKFLIEILNDKEAGQELLSREKENTGYKIPILSTFGKKAKAENNPAEHWLHRAGESPCILSSGEYNKFGEIIIANLEAARIFGYTQMELQGKKMEILMHKLYGKKHEALVKASLQRAEEGNQEENRDERRTDRLILAKSKTGYLIPLQLETKIFFLSSQGAILGALFKSEKKSFNCCYLLLDPSEEIVGVSSTCVEVLKITNGLIREYKLPMADLAPDFTDPDKLEKFRTKEGAAIEFFFPDCDKRQDEKSDPTDYSVGKDSKDAKEEEDEIMDEAGKGKVLVSKESVKMRCHVMNVQFTGDEGVAGYIVRLERIVEERISPEALKSQEELAYPEFQIVFDPASYQYLCAWSREDMQKEKEKMLMKGKGLGVIYEYTSKTQEDGNEDEGDEGKATKLVRRQTTIDINAKRIKDYGVGIKTKQLQDGVFIEITEINKMRERELEERAKMEEEKQKDEDKDLMSADAVKDTLKSRKGLIAVIKDKSDPPSIVNLKIMGYIIILAFLAMTCTEFGVVVTKFKTINESMELVRASNRRITLFMSISFYLNMAVFANPNNCFGDSNTCIQRYFPANFDEFVSDKREKISTALAEIYREQNKLTLSKTRMSDSQRTLLNNKVVSLEFKSSSGKKSAYYTLTEAILQIASSVFTITNLNSENYTLANDDIEFVQYNLFKDVYSKTMDSSSYYLEDAKSRLKYRKTIILIMFIISLVLLVASIPVLFPGISNVQNIRTQVLSLFLGIPLTEVRGLIKNCKKYSKRRENEGGDQNMAQSDTSGSQEQSSLLDFEEEPSTSTKDTQKFERVSRGRKFINNKSMNAAFFIKYTFGILVLSSLHIVNYVMSVKYLSKLIGCLPELNVTVAAHPLDAVALAMTQQLIAMDNILSLSGSQTFDFLANTELGRMQVLHHDIQHFHLNNKKKYPASYQNSFESIFLNSICELGISFSFDCETYISGVTVKGLGTVLVQYVETIRKILDTYDTIKETLTGEEREEALSALLDSSSKSNRMEEAETTVHEIMELTFNKLLDELMDTFDDMYGSQLLQRVIFFVVILVLLLFVFFIMWVPFINKLSTEIWRTKCMLTIIPKEVMEKMRSIQKFLNDPNIFSAKGES